MKDKENKKSSLDNANSAIKVRLYPTNEQAKAIDDAIIECVRWYNFYLEWYKNESKPADEALDEWDNNHTKPNKDDKKASTIYKKERTAFIKTLNWPSNSKNDHSWSMAERNPKGNLSEKYGELHYIINNHINEAVEDALCQAIRKTLKNGNRGSSVRFKSAKDPYSFTVVLPQKKKKDGTQIIPWFEQYKNTEIKQDDKPHIINRIHIPFAISGNHEPTNLETIKCSMSTIPRKDDLGLYKNESNKFIYDKNGNKIKDSILFYAKIARSITVSRNNAGEYFASIRVNMPRKEHKETGVECGVDLGVITNGVIAYNAVGSNTSEYDKYENIILPIDELKRIEQRIAYLRKINDRRIKTWLRLQQASGNFLNLTLHGKGKLSAKTEYYKNHRSENFKTTQIKIAKLSLHKANIVRDLHEKESRKLADGTDYIGFENLNIRGMMATGKKKNKDKKDIDKNNNNAKNGQRKRKRALARAISRSAMFQFRTLCTHKFGEGRIVVLDRFAPSSKTCSVCGYKNKKLKLKDREWTCPSCGTHHDRDQNAATNIRPSMQNKFL